MSAANVSNWEELRVALKEVLDSARGAKAALARHFGVKTQAVSQWLSKSSMPTADTALRLQKMLVIGTLTTTKPQPKKRAGRTEIRPALKTRKSSSKTNEKTQSGPQSR